MLARFVNSLPHGLSQRITKLYFQALLRNQRESHSSIQQINFKNMDIKILPALQDNYMYLIIDKSTKDAAIVDPVDPNTVLTELEKHGVFLKKILTTHHHWDHAGGNGALKKLFPQVEVYGGDSRIEAIDKLVTHNTKLTIGNLNVLCLATPCHTTGHICYFVQALGEGNESAVFTGDTLFLGGCGRFFEGTAEQMYKALICILKNLPDETKVFCGHEYTVQNLKFASFVDPENEEIAKKIVWANQRRQEGFPTVPSTIGEEKLYNPFMRVTEPAIMKFAGSHDAIETMKMIRLQKDNFKA